MIRRMLDEAGFVYTVVDAEEHPDLVKKYGIMQAPTLVAVKKEDAVSYVNASNILQFVRTMA